MAMFHRTVRRKKGPDLFDFMIYSGIAMSANLLLGGCTGILLLALSTNCFAASCEYVLAALQKDHHLSLVKQTPEKLTTEYRDGPNITLSLFCPFDKPNVMVSWDGQNPNQQFYDLVGRAGSLISPRTATDIVEVSKRCRRQAINGVGEIASIEQKDLVIECQAFNRDGGATIVFVFAQ
ncbi:hypothetical protein J1G35_26780 [Pseudomonas sp. SH10-3B]|uniref:hypothetical protein n=1 Tax=Pseudomonas sp. SH10-3B TaxID=2816049 RepID=UPI001CA6F3A4|nr:hypothetical protein [Pseudomonas sp. SH10-3B]MBY8949472.1 hypothetical protein [Pseudomonas sp. SH10-3B]